MILWCIRCLKHLPGSKLWICNSARALISPFKTWLLAGQRFFQTSYSFGALDMTWKPAAPRVSTVWVTFRPVLYPHSCLSNMALCHTFKNPSWVLSLAEIQETVCCDLHYGQSVKLPATAMRGGAIICRQICRIIWASLPSLLSSWMTPTHWSAQRALSILIKSTRSSPTDLFDTRTTWWVFINCGLLKKPSLYL